MDHIYIPHVTLLKTALLAHLSPRQTGQTSRLLLQFNPVVNTICFGIYSATTCLREGWNLLVCLTEKVGSITVLHCLSIREY